MKLFNRIFNSGGFSLLEIVLATSIFFLVASVYIESIHIGRMNYENSGDEFRANLLAEEGLEAIQNIRDKGFSSLTAGNHGLAISSNQWVLAGESETVDSKFTRWIAINDIDELTKNVESNVSWTDIRGEVHTVNLNTLITDWVSPPGSIPDETTIGHNADWCDPSDSLTEYDMPGSATRQSITAVPGIAYMGTGGSSNGVTLTKVLVEGSNPPIVSVEAEYDNYLANDVFGEDTNVYLATTDDSKEVVILDVTQMPYTEVGYVNGSGSTDATGVSVSGNVGLLAQGRRLRSFDVTSKDGSRPILDSVSVAGWFGYISKIVIRGDYAFLSLYNDWYELAIVDISDPNNLDVVSYSDVNIQQAADLYVNETGDRVYFGTNSFWWFKEFFIIDTSVKSGQRPVIGEKDTYGMNVKGIAVVNDRAIVVGSGGEEYQVFDINDESNPVQCGGLNINTGISDVASVVDAEGNSFSYIVTGDTSAEMKIIEGGYADSGVVPKEVVIVR